MAAFVHVFQQPHCSVPLESDYSSMAPQLLAALHRVDKAQSEITLANFELAAVFLRWILEGNEPKANPIDALCLSDPCVILYLFYSIAILYQSIRSLFCQNVSCLSPLILQNPSRLWQPLEFCSLVSPLAPFSQDLCTVSMSLQLVSFGYVLLTHV